MFSLVITGCRFRFHSIKLKQSRQKTVVWRTVQLEFSPNSFEEEKHRLRIVSHQHSFCQRTVYSYEPEDLRRTTVRIAVKQKIQAGSGFNLGKVFVACLIVMIWNQVL